MCGPDGERQQEISSLLLRMARNLTLANCLSLDFSFNISIL